jgi:predicted membrane protein (TIGR00267 family)
MKETMSSRVNPLHYRAASFVVVYVALIDSLSPVLTAAISLSPFILASARFVTVPSAYVLSLALSMATLFLLGVYLGKVAKESGWLYGIATLTMGVLTAIIILAAQLLMNV